jgi:hypothetical protein
MIAINARDQPGVRPGTSTVEVAKRKTGDRNDHDRCEEERKHAYSIF